MSGFPPPPSYGTKMEPGMAWAWSETVHGEGGYSGGGRKQPIGPPIGWVHIWSAEVSAEWETPEGVVRDYIQVKMWLTNTFLFSSTRNTLYVAGIMAM